MFYDNEYIEVLELLSFIQLKLGLNFLLPDRNITNEETFMIRSIGYLIRGNMVLAEEFQRWDVELDSEKTIEFLEQIEKQGVVSYYDICDDLEDSLFGTSVNLGRVHYFCEAVTISDEEKAEIVTQISNKEKSIKIRLQPFNNSLILSFYENYLENGKEFSEEKIKKIIENSFHKHKELE